MWKKVLGSILLPLLVVPLSIQSALGKEYPSKPIEILCPYLPGGQADIMSRMAAEIASKYLGQPMVVVTKTGAGGSIAAADVITSKPDGYKIVWLSNIFFATTLKTQKVPFDPSHLVPIANMVETRMGIWVRSDSPWKTLTDLLDYARKTPGGLKWAHSARGNTVHLNGMLVFEKAGLKTIDIPYKGGAQECITALLGGHVDAMSMTYGSVAEHLRAGSVRLLVFYGDRRYSDLPTIPCTTELGFPGVGKLATLFGFYAHRDTPEKIRETLTSVFKKTSEDPDLKKGFEKLGEEPRYGSPDFVREAIKKAEEVGVPILKQLGLYVGK